MLNQNNTNEINDYRKSILFDQISAFVPEVLYIVFYNQIELITNGSTNFLFFFLGAFSLAYFLLSDSFLLGRSLGKRIFKLKVFSEYPSKKKIPVHLLIYRRVLEVTIHPMAVRSFLSRTQIIDKMTHTYLGFSQRKHN